MEVDIRTAHPAEESAEINIDEPEVDGKAAEEETEVGCLCLSTDETKKENLVLAHKQRIVGIKLGKDGDRFRSVQFQFSQ